MKIGHQRAATVSSFEFPLFRSLAVILIMAVPALAGRDWKTNPAIAQYPQLKLLLAIGDIHGDYPKALDLLTGAGIIKPSPAKPQDVQWAAGDATLVCTGDMIDKWNQGIEVLQLMRALQTSAEKSGGKVVVTLGNHEAEFLAAGGKDKKGAEFEDELKKLRISVRLRWPRNRFTGPWGMAAQPARRRQSRRLVLLPRRQYAWHDGA